MSNKFIRISNWKFDKDENAKLIWIGEPFKENKKWTIYAFFRSNNITKQIKLDWATVHFLSINKVYKNGLVNKAEIPINTKILELNFDGIRAKYNERDWKIYGTEIETKSKTFNFSKNGNVYTVPIIEIIRTVLAPDRFMLNLILSMDTIDNYFTYDINDDVLDLYFTSEYEKGLLRNEKINHLAWILANKEILGMMVAISNNISHLGIGELKFNFLLNNFRIRARVEEKGNLIKILEILAVTFKNVNVKQINVYHPSLEKIIDGNQAKKKEFTTKDAGNDRELTNDSDGSTYESEFIETNIVGYEYVQAPTIVRKSIGMSQNGSYGDKNTKKYFGKDVGKRSLGDVGGENRLKGLEFTNLAEMNIKGELEEFIRILKLLERRSTILKIEVIVNYMPEFTGYKFGRLSDGHTRRKYAIGKLIMKDGRISSLIEIEREVRSLSMLVIQSNSKANLEMIYSGLLEELIRGSGNWSNKVIAYYQSKGIGINRIKHFKKSVYERANNIYIRVIT